jgi:hypothetical protein
LSAGHAADHRGHYRGQHHPADPAAFETGGGLRIRNVHEDVVFTPPDESGIIELTSSRSLDVMTLAWGAKARDRRRFLGPIFFRPLMVKGVFCALTISGVLLSWELQTRFSRPTPALAGAILPTCRAIGAVR